MDFYAKVSEFPEKGTGQTFNPYAGKHDDDWMTGTISIGFLNEHFGHLQTAEEMKNATESEGLKLYFQRLKDEGILN